MTVQDEPAVESPRTEGHVTANIAAKPLMDKALIAQLGGDANKQGLGIDGEGGVARAVDEAGRGGGAGGELAAHLAYDKHERAGEEGPGTPATAPGPRLC